MNDLRLFGANRNPVTDHMDLWTSALLVKSTAGRGNNGRLEAYGIRKLRELILGTALRGLFEQENEPLPETIERDIDNARKSYFKSIGKKSKEVGFGPPLLNEFKLPSGWRWKRVGELCDLQTGATPSTQKPEYFGGDIRWLVSGDINQGIIEDCEGRITEEGLAKSNCKVLPPKTVLIALNGQGKTRASVALLNVPAACNQSLVGMIPFDSAILNSTFLLLSLKYRYYEIRDITGQNQRRGLNMGLVSELSIPLPPLKEQRRIVAKVDELMALCDQLEQQQGRGIEAHQTLIETLLGALTSVESAQEFAAAWSRIAEHFDTLFTAEDSIDQLKQIILQLGVMGKLVPQDVSDEPAQAFLKRIAKEKARLVDKGLLKKEKPLPDHLSGNVPFQIPPNWQWVNFEDIAIITSGLTLGKKHIGKKVVTLPYLRVANVQRGHLLLDEVKEIEVLESEVEKLTIFEGDLLITEGGDWDKVGRTAIWRNELPRVVHQNHVFKVRRLLNEQNEVWLEMYLNSKVARAYFSGSSKQTTNLASINKTQLRACPVALPPLAEQSRIIAKVDELMTLCDALKARLAEAQTTQIHLADASVERAVAAPELSAA